MELEIVRDFYVQSQRKFMQAHPEISEDEYYDIFDAENETGLMSREVFDTICGEYGFEKAAECYFDFHSPDGMEHLEALKDKAVSELQSDDVDEARRILDGLGEGTWYWYKYGQGPYPLVTVDDVAKFIGLRETPRKKSA